MSGFQPLANHLWQSTLFAAAAGLLTLALKNNRAQTRYWLWLAASLKFLVPFSLLVEAGAYFERPPAATPVAPSSLTLVFEQVSQPFAAPDHAAAAAPPETDPLPAILFAAWTIGFLAVASSWLHRWRQVRAAVRAACPLHLPLDIDALSSPAFFEPGVFGILRPVLLLPDGIADHLTPAQFDAILGHELNHIRRRDNLATALHMTVEAVFWFHPLVWWLGARLMDERERACDEEVLRQGSDPEVYAEGILKICERYIAQPLPCVAGVTGANLKQRIEDIMTGRAIFHLTGAKKTLLAAAALLAIAGPIVFGVTNAPQLRAQSKAPKATFEVISIKPHPPGDNRFYFPGSQPGGRFRSTAPLSLVISTAFNLPMNPRQQLTGVPAWADSPEGIYDIEATGTIPSGLSDSARQDVMRSMIVSLLADRFKMTYHRETKELPIYTLSVGKNGPKLQKADIEEKDCLTAPPPADSAQPAPFSAPTTCHAFNGGRGRGLHARAANMADMVRFVENWTDRPLLDNTGIKGLYRFDTKGWLPMEVGPPPAAGTRAEDGQDVADVPTIFEVFEQMGLKMEPQKGHMDIYVVDHLEKPTEN